MQSMIRRLPSGPRLVWSRWWMPSWSVLDRRLDVGRAGDRRDRPAEDQVPRVVRARQDAAGVARQREVAADELVRVVVEVVLDGDLVELHVRVGRAEVGEEADLVVQAVDVEELALDVGIASSRRSSRCARRGAPDAAHRAGRLLAERPAAELVAPADDLALDVGHDPDDVVDVQRHVELVVRVEPAALRTCRVVFEIGS